MTPWTGKKDLELILKRQEGRLKVSSRSNKNVYQIFSSKRMNMRTPSLGKKRTLLNSRSNWMKNKHMLLSFKKLSRNCKAELKNWKKSWRLKGKLEPRLKDKGLILLGSLRALVKGSMRLEVPLMPKLNLIRREKQ